MSLKARYKERLFLRQCKVGPGLEIGPTASCFNAGPKENIRIGDHVTIYGRLETQENGTIQIGDYTNIRFNSHIGAVGKVTIGRHVIISNNVYIYDNNNHPTSPKRRRQLTEDRFGPLLNSWANAAFAPVLIEDNVWIGFGAVILKGVTIGRGSIIGAHAVVTNCVPPFSVVAGNPAVVVKKIENDLDK